MKKCMKTIAMFSLSACVLTAGAISSFAAAPTASTVKILGHATSTCEEYRSNRDNDNAVIVAQFKDADDTAKNYTICAEGGEVNGKATLTKVNETFANFTGLQVYTGTLDNGEKIMTVACLGGSGAMTGVSANVELPRSAVEGYDLYLVNADGTETKLDVSLGKKASMKVNMEDGAALIRMVAQN